MAGGAGEADHVIVNICDAPAIARVTVPNKKE
jgi:hypothetical protein